MIILFSKVIENQYILIISMTQSPMESDRIIQKSGQRAEIKKVQVK